MLIKLTNKCSIGCIHCLSDCKPDSNEHMNNETLNTLLDFLINNNIYSNIIISGGEPTEHPKFEEYIKIIINRLKTIKKLKIITITTNGFWILDNIDKSKSIVNMSDNYTKVFFQISTDDRYYPKKINKTKRIWREDGFIFCDDCVEQIYPIGRAKDNNIYTNRLSSQCTNIKLLRNQLYIKNNYKVNPDFIDIIHILENKGKFCTPSINYNGDICIGESSLCTPMSSIFKTKDEINNDFWSFECHRCDFINEKGLTKEINKLINMKIK